MLAFKQRISEVMPTAKIFFKYPIIIGNSELIFLFKKIHAVHLYYVDAFLLKINPRMGVFRY